MKMRILVVIPFLACSCSSNVDVKRDKAICTVVAEGLYTSFPGDFLYTGNYLVWTDPFSDTFLHIVDAQNGESLKSIVKIGQGPNEFSTPNVSLYNKDSIYIRDLNEDKEAYISLKAGDQGYTVTELKDRRFFNADIFMPISGNQWLSYGTFEEEDMPFAFASGSDYKRFGKYPFDENFDNKYICQGYVAYNREKQILVYSSIDFPYMATYKIGKEPTLAWENKSKIDYTLTDNEIRLSKDNRKGCSGLALTQNHIVTLEYDYDVDKVEYPVGRDFSKVPHKLFVRNYDGKLERIIDVEKPVIRLAANESGDFVYAIVIDPEFNIVKIDCED